MVDGDEMEVRNLLPLLVLGVHLSHQDVGVNTVVKARMGGFNQSGRRHVGKAVVVDEVGGRLSEDALA